MDAPNESGKRNSILPADCFPDFSRKNLQLLTWQSLAVIRLLTMSYDVIVCYQSVGLLEQCKLSPLLLSGQSRAQIGTFLNVCVTMELDSFVECTHNFMLKCMIQDMTHPHKRSFRYFRVCGRKNFNQTLPTS